jgi:predicted O-methyltransferase YrrM
MKSALKRFLARYFPLILIARDRARLRRVPVLTSNAQNLVPLSDLNLSAIFTPNKTEIDVDWDRFAQALSTYWSAGRNGGVNRGDRRAIYYLIRALRPQNVLEIGTHIGSSTVAIAAAQCHLGPGAHLDTVDIHDVNDPVSRRWVNFGSDRAPAELVAELGNAEAVTFTTGDSVSFMESTTRRYDFIFLDGNHAPQAVYREVPLALRRLNPGGVILLHDFYPALRPLMPGGGVIYGPCLAMRRFKREGAAFDALPLGELPWKTKLGSRYTSLALLGRV